MASSLIGTVLPSYARPDLAWINARPLPLGSFNDVVFYMAGGEYIEQVESVYFKYVSDNTAGNRVMLVQLYNEDMTIVALVPGSSTLPASTRADVQAGQDLGSAYSATSAAGEVFIVIPFPPVLIYPGWQIEVGGSGGGPGDQISEVFLTSVMIPTGDVGPPLTSTIEPTPTLLLV